MTVYPPISEEESSEEEEDEEEEEDDKQETVDGGHASSSSHTPLTRKRKRDHTIPGMPTLRHHRSFYTSSSFGPPSSALMFLLAYQLYKSDNDMLWLAILGLTDQLVHNRIDQKKYFSEVDRYRKEVMELNQQGGEVDGGKGATPGVFPLRSKIHLRELMIVIPFEIV